MNKTPVVLLDACVLYPFFLRDFLVHLSFTSKLYHPRWTAMIQDEWSRNLVGKVKTIDDKKIDRIQKLMNKAIPDALIPESEFEHIIPTISLPDKDDAHVLAAAIAGNTEAIISFNIKDFPTKDLEPHGLKVISPDDFVLFLASIDIEKVLMALTVQASIMQNPPKSSNEVLNALRKCGLKDSVDLLSHFSHL